MIPTFAGSNPAIPANKKSEVLSMSEKIKSTFRQKVYEAVYEATYGYGGLGILCTTMKSCIEQTQGDLIEDKDLMTVNMDNVLEQGGKSLY